ncbi:unnamed protein product [Coccothraustes coccothraustes]
MTQPHAAPETSPPPPGPPAPPITIETPRPPPPEAEWPSRKDTSPTPGRLTTPLSEDESTPPIQPTGRGGESEREHDRSLALTPRPVGRQGPGGEGAGRTVPIDGGGRSALGSSGLPLGSGLAKLVTWDIRRLGLCACLAPPR